MFLRCGFGWGLAFLRYGGYWKDCRRAFHQDFQSDAVKKFRPIEEKAAHQLLVQLLESSDDLMQHLRQCVCELYAAECHSNAVLLQYGGQGNPENCIWN